MKEDSINKCQYWSTHEPLQCAYWDNDSVVCKYKFEAEFAEDETPIDAEFAPYCNIIGTFVSCDQYKSPTPGDRKARCVLPDPRRHVCNRDTGYKWVTAGSTTSGASDESYTIKEWGFDVIDGYNDGTCDNNGTDTTCSGYAPYHLGFGILQPSPEENKYDTFKENRFSTTEEFGYRLPTNFVVYNLRATLSKCFWWKPEHAIFLIDADTGKVELNTAWACSNTNDTSEYSEFTLEKGPPCNGCKPECPYYTGVCWQYCIDEKMEDGDPILAEQIHELRYYCRENQWTETELKEYFFDNGNIYTWDGDINYATDPETENDEEPSYVSQGLKGKLVYTLGPDGYIQDYQIPSYRTYLTNFRYLTINQDHLVISKGTPVVDKLENYPSLVREVTLISLAPIIKNQFSGPGQDLFETKYLSDKNTDVLIYGKSFSSSNVYAINISETEAHSVMPYQLFEFDSMLDIQLDYGQQKYEKTSSLIIDVLKSIMQVDPNKIISNSLSNDTDDFIFQVPTFYSNNIYNNTNENIVMVFQIIGDKFVYSKTKFKKEFVGGMLVQTEFTIEGDGVSLRDCFDYTKSFYGHVNKNNLIGFRFVPIRGNTNSVGSTVNYIYNDLYKAELVSPTATSPLKPTVNVGHTLYKHTENSYILINDTEDLKRKIIPLGTSGHLLLDLDHDYLNNVFNPWEVDNITIHYNKSGNTAKLEIIYRGGEDGLGLQQVIVKHKNDVEIESVCENDSVIFEELVFWEKISYDQEPVDCGTTEIDESDDIIWNKGGSVGETSISGDTVTISNFKFTMVPSVVINNSDGIPFTQFRTKPIGWVKQPKCPDVEIMYAWAANYNKYTNTPVCACCGPFKMIDPKSDYRNFYPLCGDHDLSSINGKGSMWWPYTSCDSYAQYEINNNLSNYSIDVIGLFKQENEGKEKIHGDHDMRMLGPPNYTAHHEEGCNFIKACTCDWRTKNSKKVGDNLFIGFARYRGIVDNATLYIWLENNEDLPKFGNVNRAQLDTYRTIDNWQYLKSSDGGKSWSVDSMLMPAAMMFSKADFTDDLSDDQMWDFGASSYGPPVVNPLGLFISNNLDGIMLNEKVDYKNRFTFDDVFTCRNTTDSINYPDTIGDFVNTKEFEKIHPWYEFKRYPVGGGDLFIQWAWQEVWKSPARNNNSDTEDLNSGSFTEFIQGSLGKDTDNIKGPFLGEDSFYGIFKFLDVDHSNYKYNYKNKEFKTTIDEGRHTITLEVPTKSLEGEYEGYCGVALDDGPLRGFDWEGNWLTSSSVFVGEKDEEYYNIELYEHCVDNAVGPTGHWIDDVTLFIDAVLSDNMEQQAIDDGRDIERYEGEDVKEHLYYQYGLSIDILSSLLSGENLPLQVTSVSEGDMVVIPPLPIEVICGSGTYEELGCTFSYIKTIGKISFSFYFGSEEIDEENYMYYHIPQVTVYISEDGTSLGAEEVFRTDKMELYTGESNGSFEIVLREYEWFNDLSYISEGKLGLYIKFRTTPTSEELEVLTDSVLARYNSSSNLIKGINFSVFEESLVDAVENIYTYERKYYVSYGAYGDSPPQGKAEEGFVFQPRANHKSTVFQRRSYGGVQGIDGSDQEFEMTSKVRGAYLYDMYEDKERLDGDLSELETKQKEIFDLAISNNPEIVLLTSMNPPGLSLDTLGLNIETGVQNVLYNSLLSQLAAINSFDTMSGEGHQYLPGPFSKEVCGHKNACGILTDSSFRYEFKNMDPGSTNEYTGTMGDPLDLFYMGTKYMLDRIELNESIRAGIFGPKYGASSANKIWKEDQVSELLFYILTTFISDPMSSAPSVPYNQLLFALQGNWHNAFFGVSNYV